MPAPHTDPNLWQCIILGAVQGITEFLPVSSSGHLVVLQHFFDLPGSRLAFDLAVHLGTLVAVVIFFRRDIVEIVLGLGRELSARRFGRSTRFVLLLVAASVPAAAVGLGLRGQVEALFHQPWVAVAMFVVTAGILLATRRVRDRGVHPLFAIPLTAALAIGAAQALAILPGLSRSGATIAAGMFLLVRRDDAARFSFLLSIPAIGGAFLLELLRVADAGVFLTPAYLAGFGAAGGAGLGALKLLTGLIHRNRFHVFAPYLLAAAAVTAAALLV